MQEAEGTPIGRAMALMDVNFWGAVTVSIEAVRFFREENPKVAGGMLVQVSSGWVVADVSGVSRKSGNVVYGILCDFYSSPFLALYSFIEVLAKCKWARPPSD
jgi:hypothetical protein